MAGGDDMGQGGHSYLSRASGKVKRAAPSVSNGTDNLFL